MATCDGNVQIWDTIQSVKVRFVTIIVCSVLELYGREARSAFGDGELGTYKHILLTADIWRQTPISANVWNYTYKERAPIIESAIGAASAFSVFRSYMEKRTDSHCAKTDSVSVKHRLIASDTRILTICDCAHLELHVGRRNPITKTRQIPHRRFGNTETEWTGRRDAHPPKRDWFSCGGNPPFQSAFLTRRRYVDFRPP